MSINEQEGATVIAKRVSQKQHSIKARDLCHHSQKILKQLNNANYEAYLVGGAVRDLLLDLKPKDFDIATVAHPEQIKRVFPTCRLIGRRFRLAHVHFGRHYLEVATFRAPHEDNDSGTINNDGRIVHDNVYGTLEEDALRRDFTVNALFYDLQTGDVIDHVNGMADIDEKLIRLIGDPETRYREDPVRMLRAIRFAVKLDFQIEYETAQPIYKLGHLLRNIAPARLFDETLKLFHGGDALEVFRCLRHYNLFQYLFPATEESLVRSDNEQFLDFIEIALENTDKRIRKGMSTTPAFLLAVMLWDKLLIGQQKYIEEGQPSYQATQLAASDAVSEQVRYIAVPRRFSTVSREIWLLQSRFIRKDCRGAFSFTEHKRFRGAYDFYCLRAKSGELDLEECEWWSQFQAVSHDEQMEMCRQFSAPKRRQKKKK